MAVINYDSAIDRVRLAVADVQDIQMLPDTVYEKILEQNNNNEVTATRIIAGIILGLLSPGTRCRLDRIETYGNQYFENYLKFIEKVINNPTGIYSSAGIYAAGIYVQDVLDNQADTEIVQRRLPINGPLGEYTALYIDPEDTF